MAPFLSLKQRIFTAVLAPAAFVVVLVGGLVSNAYIVELKAQQRHQALAAAALAASFGAQLISSGELHRLTAVTTATLEQPGLRWVRIIDSNGYQLAASGPTDSGTSTYDPDSVNYRTAGTRLHLTQPIYHHGIESTGDNTLTSRQLLGWVELVHERQAYLLSRNKPLLWSALATLAALLSAATLAMLFYRFLSAYFRQTRHLLRRLANTGYQPQPRTATGGEADKLAVEIERTFGSLHTHILDLQREIDQRTADLHETLRTIEAQNTELELARRDAVAASKLKSRFLANTSHEIRTPLHAIIGFGELLLKFEQDPRRRESLQMILYSAENLLGIINDTLDFSMLEAGKLKLEQTPLNLRKLAEEVLAMVAPTCMDKDLELVLFSEPPLPPPVIGDPLRLKQILTNLVGNAIKFSHKGFVSTRLEIHAGNTGTADIRITVTDSGIGLSPAQQMRLFEAFSQADLSTARKFGGNGLGLAIVKGLIEQMQGYISVDSTPGAGSSFQVALELPVAEGAQDRDFSQLRGVSVALYERSNLSRHALTALLESWQMQVIQCRNPADLCERAADIMILGLDQSITQYLKDYPNLFDVPMLVLAPPRDSYVISQQVACLPKPAPHLGLYNTLSTILNGKQGRDEQPEFSAFPQLNVLAVDDNPVNQKVVGALLENYGINTVTVDSGAAALEVCEKQPFNLVLVDMQMPDMDGYETARRLRQLPACANTSVIALSAFAAPEDMHRLHQAGIDDYLEKPLTMAKLSQILGRIAGERTTSPPLFDPARNAALAANRPQLAREMLALMLRSVPATCRQLRQCLDSNDIDAIRDIHHQLKGACCYLGLPRLEAALADMDSALGADAVNAEDVSAMGDKVGRVIEVLDALLEWQRATNLDTTGEAGFQADSNTTNASA